MLGRVFGIGSAVPSGGVQPSFRARTPVLDSPGGRRCGRLQPL